MNPFRIFQKKQPESIEDRKNRIESAIKTHLNELTTAQRIEVLKRIVPHVDPDKRIYRYHPGRKAA